MATDELVLALPKGRILKEVLPLLRGAGIEPEADFHDAASRKLKFDTNIDTIKIIRVRSFDVATFVAFGAADLGVAGNDVLLEFDYSEIFAPIDLGIGYCRLCLAEPLDLQKDDDPRRWSHVRVATKYPHVTRKYYAERGIQAECIKLNGAMELAPKLGLCDRIVDLVSSGATLKANGLGEVETLYEITSRLIVNRASFKTRPKTIRHWMDRFQEAVDAVPA